MEELKSAINEVLHYNFYKTAIDTVVDRKEEAYDLVRSLQI